MLGVWVWKLHPVKHHTWALQAEKSGTMELCSAMLCDAVLSMLQFEVFSGRTHGAELRRFCCVC